MSGPIRIGILEDQQIFRDSLVTLFQGSGMEVVVQGRETQGFLAQVLEAKPDVVLVDLRLESPDSQEVGDGLKVVEALREQQSQIRALVLSSHRELPVMERCFQAGAAGYLSKLTVNSAELITAVEQVARGEWVVPADFMSPVQAAARSERAATPLDRLTLREREVLGLVASGADNLQISARLGITERTVKAHVSNLYRKLGVQNRVEMAMMAYQSGLSTPADSQHP
ncbi:DNA-binding NarL/FixJ family response regulator [Archangium gephyra]|uniref:DNA-binding NarL/FixJ family response regulator n=1 Tax=Archangium gephyra TaxID=48 RepID=A0AAC8Q2X7_9BACT|nr:response regulator transcription factor [Archangium gephyra]AKJ00033.1 two component transcriptional regulator, LuxR family [Archangium gephyra]REG33262.1 DNA-binding NarL/FixJ family response regulator [Archangium gephyra]